MAARTVPIEADSPVREADQAARTLLSVKWPAWLPLPLYFESGFSSLLPPQKDGCSAYTGGACRDRLNRGLAAAAVAAGQTLGVAADLADQTLGVAANLADFPVPDRNPDVAADLPDRDRSQAGKEAAPGAQTQGAADLPGHRSQAGKAGGTRGISFPWDHNIP